MKILPTYHRRRDGRKAPALLVFALLLSGCSQSSVFTSAAPLPAGVTIPYSVGSDASSAGVVIGFLGRDGSTAWQAKTGEQSTQFPPLIVGDVVYTEGGMPQPPSGTVVAIRLSDGHILWQTPMPTRDFFIAADDSIVLVAAGSDGLYALDAGDGSIRWHLEGMAKYPIHVGHGIVVATWTDPQSQGAHVEVNRESDGAPLWKLSYDPTVFVSENAVVTSLAGDTQALSLQTGEQLWHSELLGDVVAVTARAVIVAAPQSVTALDPASGHVVWEKPESFDVIGRVASSSAAIFGTSLGVLRALRISDGGELWHRTFEGYTVLQIAPEDGVLFVLLAGGPESSTPARIAAVDGATGAVYWERDVVNGAILYLADIGE